LSRLGWDWFSLQTRFFGKVSAIKINFDPFGSGLGNARSMGKCFPHPKRLKTGAMRVKESM
jgi:hypothetical protein